MRRLMIVAVLVACGAAVANLHVAAQSYTPVIRVASPDGLTYTALFEPRADWHACAEANRRFLDPIKARCAACDVVFARCERESPQIDEISKPEHLWVATPGVKLSISGPEGLARRSCRHIALDIARRGASPDAPCMQSFAAPRSS